MRMSSPIGTRAVVCIGAACVVAHAVAGTADGFAFDIAAGKFDEHCLKLDAGEAIRWRFAATGPVDFNIHVHRGNAVIFPVRRDGVQRASGSFRSRTAEDYCLMWTNVGGTAVTLHGSVERRP
jgi:hypothetical protein